MTDFVWTDSRERAVEAFGDTPSDAIEGRILTVFQRNPAAVAQAISHIAERYRRGLVRSPWPVLALAVEEIDGGREIVATDTRARDKAIAGAERWIRSTGIHFDRAEQVVAELFAEGGERGPILGPWENDAELIAAMTALWEQERPRGERVEREAVAHAEAWKRARR